MYLFYSKLILGKKGIQYNSISFCLVLQLCCCYCEQWYLHLFEDKSQSEGLLDSLDSSSHGKLEDSKETSRFWSNCRTGILPAFYHTILLSDKKTPSLVQLHSRSFSFFLSPCKSMHPTAVPRTLFSLVTAVISQVP